MAPLVCWSAVLAASACSEEALLMSSDCQSTTCSFGLPRDCQGAPFGWVYFSISTPPLPFFPLLTMAPPFTTAHVFGASQGPCNSKLFLLGL